MSGTEHGQPMRESEQASSPRAIRHFVYSLGSYYPARLGRLRRVARRTRAYKGRRPSR